MKRIALALVMTSTLIACGGSSKRPASAPESTAGATTTETKGSAMGGATYGGAPAPAPKTDPCEGQ